jgi:hypothetical protein
MQQHHGLRKRCRCKRKDWPKCSHSWHLNFKPRGGLPYRLSLDREVGRHIDSKSEALTEAERIRQAIRGGTFRSRDTGGVVVPAAAETFEAFARSWLRTVTTNLKASTYTDCLENHVFPILGARPIAAVGRKDCRELITTVREKGLKIVAVRGVTRTLSAVLSQAVEDENLSANPALRLGHASIQITVDIYGHLVPGGNHAAVDRLDDRTESVAQPLHTAASRTRHEAA